MVATCAHVGNDARIAYRQISALLEAGHRVTLVAPPPVPFDRPGFSFVEVTRARGCRRLRAWREVRRSIQDRLGTHDFLIVHDPELVPLCARLKILKIWDVHEDYNAVLQDRRWIPRALRVLVGFLVSLIEGIGKRYYRLLIAETSYLARFPEAVVVLNSIRVPDVLAFSPIQHRVIYIGRISSSRGLLEMIQIGEALKGEVVLEFIGPVDYEDEDMLRSAVADGVVRWEGPLPNDQALRKLEGALVGLSLLHDLPNFRNSIPTKILEYYSRGVPVIATPLPGSMEVVNEDLGFLFLPSQLNEITDAIRTLKADSIRRIDLGENCHDFVKSHFNWDVLAEEFVGTLELWGNQRL